jgi:hypothetical protein
MESVSDVRSEQRAVTEFLLAENESITNIHRRLTTSLETWQWIKAPSAFGQSDWHRQNKDRAMCLISRARVVDQ